MHQQQQPAPKGPPTHQGRPCTLPQTINHAAQVCDSDCLASQRQSESACYDLYYFDFNSSWTEHALYIAVPLEQALLACAVESEACTSAVDAAVTVSDGRPPGIQLHLTKGAADVIVLALGGLKNGTGLACSPAPPHT